MLTEKEMKQAMDEMENWYDTIKPTIEELDLMADTFSGNVDGRLSGFYTKDNLSPAERRTLVQYLNRVLENMEPKQTLYIEKETEQGTIYYTIGYTNVEISADDVAWCKMLYLYHECDPYNYRLILSGYPDTKAELDLFSVARVWLSRGTDN